MSKSGCPAEAEMYVIEIILVTPICTDNLTNYSSCCVKMSSPYNNGKTCKTPADFRNLFQIMQAYTIVSAYHRL
jgi:hypothetical protein